MCVTSFAEKMANSGGGQFSDDAQYPDRFTSPGAGKQLAVAGPLSYCPPFEGCEASCYSNRSFWHLARPGKVTCVVVYTSRARA